MGNWLRWILQGDLPYLRTSLAWDFDGFTLTVSIAWVWSGRLLNQRSGPWCPRSTDEGQMKLYGGAIDG